MVTFTYVHFKITGTLGLDLEIYEEMSLPILFLWLRCSIGTPLAIFIGHIAALSIRSILVLQDVLDAEFPAVQAWL